MPVNKWIGVNFDGPRRLTMNQIKDRIIICKACRSHTNMMKLSVTMGTPCGLEPDSQLVILKLAICELLRRILSDLPDLIVHDSNGRVRVEAEFRMLVLDATQWASTLSFQGTMNSVAPKKRKREISLRVASLEVDWEHIELVYLLE